jgi:acetyl-CoA carboxylase biotin carboxyl carrier protein
MEILAPLTGVVFRVLVSEGDKVAAGDTVVVLESMKMEINVDAVLDGTVKQIVKQEGEQVDAEQPLVILE